MAAGSHHYKAMYYREIICIWLPNWSLQRLWADDVKQVGESQEAGEPQVDTPIPPAVIYRDAGQHGCRVVTFCSQAAEYGVAHNMPLAEASALLPYEIEQDETADDNVQPSVVGPRFELADPKRDHSALITLAHFCQQYTPLFGVEETECPESLFLDVTGCTHLFDGQQALVNRIESDFQKAGYVARVAMAKTFGAAWAFSHYFQLPQKTSGRINTAAITSSGCVVQPEYTEAILKELPIAALRVNEGTTRRFAEFDVFTIRQLSELPRISLPSRFGKEVLLRFDQALGERSEVLKFERPPEPVQEKWSSEYSTDNHTVLLKVLDDLIERICHQLESRHQGTNELQICVSSTHTTQQARPVFQFAVRLTEPTANTKHLTDLIWLQLEREALKKQRAYTHKRAGKKNVPQAFDAEFSQVTVRANSIALLARRPRDLFGGLLNQDNEKELRTLLDRLSNRLGSEAVVQSSMIDDPQPELMFEWIPFVGQENKSRTIRSKAKNKTSDQSQPPNTRTADHPSHNLNGISRPLSLYSTPIPIEVQLGSEPLNVMRFRCRRKVFQVTAIEGPERIQTGWWRSDPIKRDYIRVHTQEQQHFWLFRCGTTRRWFLQGVFD
jgi:protein ImuB